MCCKFIISLFAFGIECTTKSKSKKTAEEFDTQNMESRIHHSFKKITITVSTINNFHYLTSKTYMKWEISVFCLFISVFLLFLSLFLFLPQISIFLFSFACRFFHLPVLLLAKTILVQHKTIIASLAFLDLWGDIYDRNRSLTLVTVRPTL